MTIAPLLLLVLLTLFIVFTTALPCHEYDEFYPRHYLAYKTSHPPKIDGRILDDPVWQEVAWTEDLIDISGPTAPQPRFETRGKIRWDNRFVYVAAYLEEPQVWATLKQHDSVIFHDNDFEVFFDPDLSHHYYKEFEMNAYNTTWSLCLNKPYSNGGYENSSRVYNRSGWDDYGLQSGVYIEGAINDPSKGSKYWTVEIAFPIVNMVYNTSASNPPRNGSYWTVNFSRVEYTVTVVNNTYVKTPMPEFNWVLAPTYMINIHLPEYWAYIQFDEGPVNVTKPVHDPDFFLRYIAMQVYYGEVKYYQVNQAYTESLQELTLYVPNPSVIISDCISGIDITITSSTFQISVTAANSTRVCTVDDTRYVQVKG